MTEKLSQLLSKAKKLITNNDLDNALVLCEEVIKVDPTNINGLLLATKCWMDLDVKHLNIKNSLEKILSLKPKNETATKALKKFYENHMDKFNDDAVQFYRGLFTSNEMVEKDYETITKNLIKYSFSKETEKFICDCLLFRINNNNDINSLKTLFQIAARDFIVDKNRYYFNQFLTLIAKFDSDNMSSDADELDYLKTMETLFRAFIDGMEPEFFFTLLNENIYGYTLFAEILCDHYLFSDCHDALERAFDIWTLSDVYKPGDFYNFLKSIQIKNLIQWHNLEGLQNNWPKDSLDIIPKYLWCQAEAISFTSFRISELDWSNEKSNWCQYLADHERSICLGIMNKQSPENIVENHQVLLNSALSSFEWYLWSKVLENYGCIEEQVQALDRGSKSSCVYFKNHEALAKICSEKNDYQGAVNQLWLALDLHFCPDMLNTLVDLHMNHKKYEDPIAIFEKLELKNCSESLLEKFVKCLTHLDRITDAISTAQRLAKQYPRNGKNWQLLGDLYLERGNLSSAHTTYSRSLDLSGDSSDIFARMGNVFSLQYQETLNETDFGMSVKYYSKSLELTKTLVAIEGLSSVLYLHAEVSLKQLMFPRAVKDIQKLVDLLMDNELLLNDSDFQMNLLGKTIFLSINGSVDNLINLSRLDTFFSTFQSVQIDPYEIAEKCFEKSISKFPMKSESYLNLALLDLQKLSNRCTDNQRGSIVFPDLYNKSESNFKTALHFDSALHEAWKYLGYLYFRHGIVVGTNVLDIQHCLSTAINLTATADCLKDPEAVFLLGLLYTNENWYSLAKEVFEKLQLDYPVNPIGYIGTYLLGAKDHTVAEQMYISKAIKCYNYRDEEYSLNDCRHRLNDSIVGLFCDNLGFLIDPKCDLESFESAENCILLISDLKEALNGACIKYKALKSCEARISSEKLKQYEEYDVFLTNLNLLTGHCHWDEWLISKSEDDFDDEYSKKLLTLRNIQNSWVNNDREKCITHIKSLAQHLKLTLGEYESNDKAIFDSQTHSTQTWDDLLLMSIVSYLMSSPVKLNDHLELMLTKLPYFHSNDKLSFGMKSSITMLSTLILTTKNQCLVNSFIESIGLYFPNLDSEMCSFSRLLGRLKSIESFPKIGYQYFHGHCLKQPHDMNRWLNLLEFVLEYLDDLKDVVDISKVFFFTNRPWCFTTFDVQRYAKILQTYAPVLTLSCLSIQKNMVYHAIGLFPNLCSDIRRMLQLNQ